MPKMIRIKGLLGNCGNQEVFTGFASADLLHSISFADVLDEEVGTGYQRRFNEKHSIDFRKYIQTPGSTTIPLTFNLRPRTDGGWEINRHRNGTATLVIKDDLADVLSQVDCQHRLGFLHGLDTQLAFMTFIGLDEQEEMKVFNVINGKAKGLSGSLLDFHDAKLADDLAMERPELYVALRMNDDEDSPWYKRLDLGGKQTSGMTRRASLRTMQKAVKRFIQETHISQRPDIDEACTVLLDFWKAITVLLPDAWENPRKHFLSKGIGVYALNSLAADLYKQAKSQNEVCSYNYLVAELSDFIQDFDWSNTGPLKGLGGESGVQEAVLKLRALKNTTKLELIAHA